MLKRGTVSVETVQVPQDPALAVTLLTIEVIPSDSVPTVTVNVLVTVPLALTVTFWV